MKIDPAYPARRTEQTLRSDFDDVEERVKSLALTVSGLRRVRDVAMAERANVTLLHAANAAGAFAYQYGVWALREEFIGEDWTLERPGGVEAIVNLSLNVRIAFANVDRCCDQFHSPVPISGKGSGAERLCHANLFENLPVFTREESGLGIRLFYLMVDPAGRAELSRPTIQGGTFGPCVERNFVSFGSEDDDPAPARPEDLPVEFKPTVTRRAG
ncbi:hypothetical protein [Sphingomonas ginkgonis]|nr:hypothetical protein [Sphingomonas ginkgonis]